MKRLHLLPVFISIFLAACGRALPSQALDPATGTPAPSETALPSATPLPSATTTAIATMTATLTPTPTLTATPTFTPVPTYVTLRAEVIVEQVICHYGPGAPYLYKYGLYLGNNIEVIARTELGSYLEIQAIGGNNPCWVNPKWLNIKGDPAGLKPISPLEVVLPLSPYYGPPAWAKTARNGNEVTVTWAAVEISPGKDSLQTPYIVEAWVCQGGVYQFIPYGSWQTRVKIIDEPGCDRPSYARLTAAEKHGYTSFVELDWPQPQATMTPAP